MIKDDAKEQISLFDLPQQGKPVEKPVISKVKTKEEATPERKSAVKKETAKSVPQETKRKEELKPVKGEKSSKAAPGPVPEGDVRLTANIRQDLHLKLKIAAAHRRTTIGELIEELVETYL